MAVVLRSFFDCRCRWERTREVFAAIFIQKSQKEWCAVFDGTDACVTPVLRPEQLHEHPLHMARLGRLQNADTPQPPKQYLTLRPCRGTFVKGSTAVTPAPVLHEFHDASIASTAKEALVSAMTNAHTEGVLAVRDLSAPGSSLS